MAAKTSHVESRDVTYTQGMIHPSIVRKVAAAADQAHKIIAQAVANAFDAGAKNIKLDIDTHGKFVEILDDGAGMPSDRWPAFIGMGDEAKRDDPNAIGQNGTGVKSYFIAFDVIKVSTSTADDPMEHSFQFTFEDAFNCSLPGATKGIRVDSRPKTDKQACIKSSGTFVRLSSPYTGEDAVRILPSPVRSHIAKVLSPWQLEMITINGERPKIDFPKGEFYRSLDPVSGVGVIELVAGFADRPVKPSDRSWGSWGAHVLDHTELLDFLPDRLRDVFPAEFEFPNVWFMLRVPSWKKFEGKHTRRFFKPSLFTDPSFELVVRHLYAVLLPKIREHVRLENEPTATNHELIGKTMELLTTAIGQSPSIKEISPVACPPKQVLRIKPGAIELVCSQQFTFLVENTNDAAVYELDASHSGGSIFHEGQWLSEEKAVVRVKGLKHIDYRAGNECGRRYRLRVTEILENGTQGQVSGTLIRLEQELRFALNPRKLTLEPGEVSPPIRVIHETGKSEFRFELSGNGRVQILKDAPTPTVIVTAPMEKGIYRLVCQTSDGSIAECEIQVRAFEAHGEGASSDKPYKNLVVEGLVFLLRPYPSSGKKNETLSICGRGGNNIWTIWFEFNAPIACAAKNQGWLSHLLVQEVVMQISIVLSTQKPSDAALEIAIIQHRDQFMSRIYENVGTK